MDEQRGRSPVPGAGRHLVPGAANTGPRVGPVVINEFHYQPPPGEVEFIELKNLTDQPVALADPVHPDNTWRVSGIGFAFPPGTVLPPQGLAVLAGSDAAAFRARHGVPLSVPVFGPFSGVLQNSGELVELQRPDNPDLITNELGQVSVVVPYITVDAVRYNDKLPWPTNAAGLGPSLERVTAAAYGNDPASWRASPGPPSPGLENDGNRPPWSRRGRDQELETAVFPAVVSLAGTASDDGLPAGGAGLRAAWQQLSGPGRVVFTQPDSLATEVHLPGVGSYILRLTVSDGELQRSDEVSVTVQRPGTQQTLLAAGAEWRYLDDGSDQGTAWRMPGFNDAAWKIRAGAPGLRRRRRGHRGPVRTQQQQVRHHLFPAHDPGRLTGLGNRAHDEGGARRRRGRLSQRPEVLRDSMPEGDITYTTRASSTIGGADETTFIERALDPSLLRAGENLIAAEVHQVNPTSSDLGFDLQLDASVFPANQALDGAGR